MSIAKKLFVLFMDNPSIGLTGEPQAQTVTLETLKDRPGYLLSEIQDISELELDEIWHNGVHPHGLKIWRVA